MELKPCPKCKSTTLEISENWLGDEHNVGCMCGHEGPICDTRADAIAKWNTRQPAQGGEE